MLRIASSFCTKCTYLHIFLILITLSEGLYFLQNFMTLSHSIDHPKYWEKPSYFCFTCTYTLWWLQTFLKLLIFFLTATVIAADRLLTVQKSNVCSRNDHDSWSMMSHDSAQGEQRVFYTLSTQVRGSLGELSPGLESRIDNFLRGVSSSESSSSSSDSLICGIQSWIIKLIQYILLDSSTQITYLQKATAIYNLIAQST